MCLEDQGRHLVYLCTTSDGRSIRASLQPSPRPRMSLTPPFNSPKQPHRHDGPSSIFHDRLCDLHNGGEASTLSASQQAPPDVTDPACPRPPRPPDSSTHTELNLPCWKRLIRSPLTSRERIYLITTIFSNRDEVEAIRRLSREDARTFVDMIYGVSSCIPPFPKNGTTNFDLNSRVSSIRCWTTSTTHCG